MNRMIVNAVLGIGCLAAIAAMVNQNQQLARLRAEASQHHLPVQTSPVTNSLPESSATQAVSTESTLSNEEVLELMRLRNEASQLRRRQRELSDVRNENQSLRTKLAAAQTNQASTQIPLPPGYVRRREAQFAGFDTPEATLQSFLWAIANRDTNVLFRAADSMQQEFARSPDMDDFWKKASMIPGLRIIQSEPQSETEVKLTVEFAPGMEQPMTVRKIGQEWKLVH